ncbi:MAG: hypothetical protein ABJA81_04420 [Nocardioidaceae bacterium]
MPWVKTRVTDDGDKRFVACYRDPDGRQRSAGTYSSRRAAERAAHREEVKVRDGAWHDTTLGEITFRDYVDTVWLPSRHIEASSLAAYQLYLKKALLPVLRQETDRQDPPLRGPALGHHRHRRRPLPRQRPQVPHHAPLGVQASGPGPDHHVQPL